MGKKEDLEAKLEQHGHKELARALRENDTCNTDVVLNSDIKRIRFTKGNAAQHIDEKVDTSYDAYYNNHIKPNLKDGKGNGSIDYRGRPGWNREKDFDDRKYRLSKIRREGDELIIEYGPTHFGQFHKDRKRSLEERFELMEKGLNEANDPWLYFSRPIGVAVIHVSTEGNVWIGERTRGDDEGPLNAVAGQTEYYTDKIEPYKSCTKESFEECGIETVINNENAIFIGISSNPLLGDCDLVFIVYSGKPDSYYETGEWAKNVKAQGRHLEHKEPLYKISSKKEVMELLEKGNVPGANRKFHTMYSTELGLRWLAKNHFN